MLIELDSSELQKQIVQQEIQYQTALASLIDAQQNYEIQVGQNISDVKAAEQKVRFSRMDFDKFLGETATGDIVQKLGLDKLLVTFSTNDLEQSLNALSPKAASENPSKTGIPQLQPTGQPGAGTTPELAQVLRTTEPGHTTAGIGPGIPGSLPGTAASATPPPPLSDPSASPPPPKRLMVDFSQYAKIDALGDGEAKQKLRKFDDDLQLSKKELGQSTATLEGTKRLLEKQFMTRTDLERDEIAFEISRLKVQTAETARDLFLKYDFVKSAEESLSKFDEAVREFDKARRVAISRLAQARARLRSAEGQHEVQLLQRTDLKEQSEKCLIHATKPGLAIYGGNREDFYGGEERVREGAAVRERQTLITIPDMSRMSVNVKIHESYVKKIKKGLKARITVDAFPDTVLKGEVTKVGVLPDSQNRWMNPDMKVYLTTVSVDDSADWIKPGMSAKVEIMVNRIENCTFVPIQAVSPDAEKQICYVAHGGNVERREVKVGEFNDDFIEIKSGVNEGEQVLLRRPASVEPGTGVKNLKPAENQKRETIPTASATRPAKS